MNNSYDTDNMSISLKRQDDFFRHWIIGLGSGDLHMQTMGGRRVEMNVENVLFVGNSMTQTPVSGDSYTLTETGNDSLSGTSIGNTLLTTYNKSMSGTLRSWLDIVHGWRMRLVTLLGRRRTERLSNAGGGRSRSPAKRVRYARKRSEDGTMLATMAKKKSEDRHKGEPVMLRLTPSLKVALSNYAATERRSVAQAGSLLLEEILKTKGYWPPAEDSGNDNFGDGGERD